MCICNTVTRQTTWILALLEVRNQNSHFHRSVGYTSSSSTELRLEELGHPQQDTEEGNHDDSVKLDK